MYPKILDDIFIHQENNRVLYLNSECPDWITINSSYKPIFDLMNGRNKVIDIIGYVQRYFSNEAEILAPQLEKFFTTSNILEHNFLKRTNSSLSNNVPEPKYIYLTLTDRCNLHCVYCYATERYQCKDSKLETWIKYVNDILETNPLCTFIFTGGEPLLVPYIYDLASYIKSKGCENILLTNGTQIKTMDDAKIVSQLFFNIKISLDSIDESISSKLRGKNVIVHVQNAYNLLKSFNANVNILATVNSLTKNKVNDLANHFNNNVNFQPFYEVGRGRKNDNLSITGVDYYDSLTKTDVFKLLSGFHKNIHNYKNRPFKRCAFAQEEISIDPGGNIFPCHMLHYSDLNCGNLNDNVFKDIYYNSSVLINLRKINIDNIKQCSICHFRNICGGACRARVDFLKNGISGVNEFCDFEKKAILNALLYSFG